MSIEDKELDKIEQERNLPCQTESSNRPVPTESFDDVSQAVQEVKEEIIDEAIDLVKDKRLIKKHANALKEISDKALSADTEKQRLIVKGRQADNKAEKQAIKNRLIALKTEAKRLKREKKQVLREQKADHRKRNKDALWEIYKDKLTKMKYTYVPSMPVLKMLLFFDGVVSFFNGLGAVSTAIMKALKWIIAIVVAIAVLLLIPATRAWIFELIGIIPKV